MTKATAAEKVETATATNKKPTLALPDDKAFKALPSISARIRYLHKAGWSRGDIARSLDKRYQHVRNVLVTPVKNG